MWKIKKKTDVENSTFQGQSSAAGVAELRLSVRCLGLTVWYFLSQLCTYTPGLVFYQCGDLVANIQGQLNLKLGKIHKEEKSEP